MSFRFAWAFLTRLPGGAHPEDARQLGRSVPWFPVVGVALGLLLGAVHVGLIEVVSAPLAAILTVLLGVMATGAFHEDGLADTADALGGFTPQRRLAIMKDSRVGTFGALALIFSVLLRVLALSALGGLDGVFAIVLAHAVGRSLATAVMLAVPAAGASGLGQSYSAHLPRPAVVTSGLLVAGAACLSGPAGIVGYAVAAVGASLLVWLALRAFGGTTGDVLGAIEQIGEIAVLCAAAQVTAGYGWTWG